MERCQKHKKYNGKKMPKTQCSTCLSMYLTLKNKPRAVHKPTKMIPDKTKYNRKRLKDEYNN